MLALAGCLSTPSPPHCGADCTTETPKTDPGQLPLEEAPEALPPPPNPAPLPPTLAWESCTGSISVFYVPRDAIATVLPASFRAEGPAGMGTVVAELVQCPRTTLPTAVATDVAYLQVSVRVTPANETWHEPGSPSYYVLYFGVTDEHVARVTAELGAPAELLTLERGLKPGTNGSRLETWRVHEGGRSLETEFAVGGSSSGGLQIKTHIWHADGSRFRRVDDVKDYLNDNLFAQATLLRFSGDFPFASLLPAGGAVASLTQPYQYTDDAWQGQSIPYEGANP